MGLKQFLHKKTTVVAMGVIAGILLVAGIIGLVVANMYL
jgi:uncharacterized membrane protein